jgi:hypothetical protein
MQCLHFKPVSTHFCSRKGGGRVKSVGRSDCQKQGGKLFRLLSQLHPRIRPLGSSLAFSDTVVYTVRGGI